MIWPALSGPLLCKLASIVVHVDEMMSEDGHDFDREALKPLLVDSEVVGWIQEMSELGLAPRRRNA